MLHQDQSVLPAGKGRQVELVHQQVMFYPEPPPSVTLYQRHMLVLCILAGDQGYRCQHSLMSQTPTTAVILHFNLLDRINLALPQWIARKANLNSGFAYIREIHKGVTTLMM